MDQNGLVNTPIANTFPNRDTVRRGDTQYARPASCSRPVRARAARRAGYAVVARPPAASYPLRTAPPSSLAQQAAPLPLTCPLPAPVALRLSATCAYQFPEYTPLSYTVARR